MLICKGTDINKQESPENFSLYSLVIAEGVVLALTCYDKYMESSFQVFVFYAFLCLLCTFFSVLFSVPLGV